MNDATELARWLVQELRARGVRDVVVAPGSRNAALAFALDRQTGLAVHSRLDERTAGFLALGLAKGAHRPAAVVTTSGTATANLHPAILEAAHAGVPLVAITADRPAALRGTGANQTTDQVRLYGTAASFADLAAPDTDALDAAWVLDGPIHLNVQFTEPLVPDPGEEPPEGTEEADRLPAAEARPGRRWDTGATPVALDPRPRTVVVAGDDAGPPARLLAEAGAWPLLAEPTSGSRNGRTPIRTYRLLLETTLADEVERVVVAGHPTLSRPVSRLLARPDVEVVSLRARGRWPDRPSPVAAEHVALTVDGPTDPSWFDRWRRADDELSARLDAFVEEQPGLTPYDVAAVVNAAVRPQGLLYVGASNPIRDLDLMMRPYQVGERRLLLANRGLAGIDGTLSSAIGAALGRRHTSGSIAYVGDVTFLHDLTGLVIGPGESRPDLTVVVANDDGGSIFATLEQGAAPYAAAYEKFFGTPHGVDLGGLCRSLGIAHRRATTRPELEAALDSDGPGLRVVEAIIRRDDRRVLDEAIRGLVGDLASLGTPGSAASER